jgi:hypothetical protein
MPKLAILFFAQLTARPGYRRAAKITTYPTEG